MTAVKVNPNQYSNETPILDIFFLLKKKNEIHYAQLRIMEELIKTFLAKTG
jgi:hypothetical protein